MSCLRGSEVMAAETVHSCRSFSFSEKAKPLIQRASVIKRTSGRSQSVDRVVGASLLIYPASLRWRKVRRRRRYDDDETWQGQTPALIGFLRE